MKKALFLLAPLLVLVLLCSTARGTRHVIRLRFNANYPGDSFEKQRTGLLWALSFLGAELPPGSMNKALYKTDSVYALDISLLKFNRQSLEAFEAVLQTLRESEEYQVKGGIDLGGFIVYTLGSSWNYYAITGAAQHINDYKKRYGQDGLLAFPVLNSEVAAHNRLVEISRADRIDKMWFIAREGHGEIAKGSFAGETYEVFDIMPNGQLRFAIYDREGNLADASQKEFGNAGKPVKCLWCHEIHIQPLFRRNEAVQGHLLPVQFDSLVVARMDLLNTYRSNLKSELDFRKTQDHSFTEILYFAFMQPSAYKLRQEWGPLPRIDSLFARTPTHSHFEHKFLNKLLHRAEVKQLSPYKTVQMPDSIWDKNLNEPGPLTRKK